MATKYDKMNLNYKRTQTQEKGWSSESWDEFDKCDGHEILYDLNENATIMGQMFYEKWRKANPETMRLRSGSVDLMTNLRMFGKYFMCDIRLVEGAMPPTLGREFFDRYGWSISDNGKISSPIGDILITPRREDMLKGRIEEIETERIYKCSELVMEMEGKKDKRKVLTKFHKYFGWSYKSGSSI